ncbi:hypothetical protein DL93DRAFT_2080568 [Clavulina sp. PMI_390]|nr:hypothetical protein DL93DRAFT_2080568 [Clavulina sp. PMI_390]
MVDANDHSVGVLIDLDIAIHVRDGEKKLSFPPAPGGTYAFRAIDILRQGEPVTKVFYRHDLESFMYSLMWIVTHYIAPDQEDRFDLMAWDQEDPKGAASSKEGVIIGLAGEISSWPLTDGWFPRMARLFKEGRRRQFRATQDGRDIDEETYGGFITFESFRAILDDYHS